MAKALTEEQLKAELEQEKQLQENPKKETKKKDPPMGYIPIKLDSLGKLDAPAELHFRDFSFGEALDLADSTLQDNNNIKKVISCLNEMVWEGFDCSYLHLNELYEILFTLQRNFYEPFIEKEVYVDDTLPKGELDEPINIIRATIPLDALETISIPEEFKEPFVIKDDKTGIEITVRLSRVKDMIDADNYWMKQNVKLVRDFSDVENEMIKISMKKSKKDKEEAYVKYATDNYERVNEYQQLVAKRLKQTAILAQGLCVVKYGSKKIDGIEDVLETMPMIPRRLWDKYIDFTNENHFGIKEEVTFICPELQNKEITRRFSFRAVDFIQNSE